MTEGWRDSNPTATELPSTAHLVWTGSTLAPVAWLTAVATLERAELERVVLHTETPELHDDVLVRDLARRGVEVRPLDLPALLRAVEVDGLDVARLLALVADLQQPAARANLVRLALLEREGGIYLDTDAPPLRSLRPLLALPGFAGLEHVALPVRTLDSRSPLPWLRAGALMAVRELCARGDAGERAFGRVERFFDPSVNNAVLGAAPGNPTIARVLLAAAALPDDVARKRYRLGTKLLESVTQNRDSAAMTMLPPAAFYPYGPEMSWHLFRSRALPADFDLARQLPQTFAVHLYDSVLRRRTGQSLDGRWLRAHRDDTMVGRLVAPWIDDLCALDAGRADAAR